ncbi:hypothetical protein JOF34_000089 [Microbacterium amylolyticum]|uniref:Uncharacterized protein n=1 Tax=Microbacterium amylolyticum TaxID=936337 RepID=A0ABS4ZES5_9MICO|nr:hypothetical protein [Microbacterium amylolyticum]
MSTRSLGEQTRSNELGVVIEELMETVDDVHAAGNAVKQNDTLRGGE